MSSVWQPLPFGLGPYATPADLSGTGLPNPAVIEGIIAYVISTDSYYQLSLTSGAAVSDDALVTMLGGTSRWLKLNIAPGPAGAPALLMFGNGDLTSTTTTRYLTPSFDGGIAPIAAIQFQLPFDCTLSNLRVRHNTTAGNGNPIVYTVRLANVATALTVSLASSSANGSDTTHSVDGNEGDLIDIEVTKAADVGTSPSDIVAYVEMVSR